MTNEEINEYIKNSNDPNIIQKLLDLGIIEPTPEAAEHAAKFDAHMEASRKEFHKYSLEEINMLSKYCDYCIEHPEKLSAELQPFQKTAFYWGEVYNLLTAELVLRGENVELVEDNEPNELS